MSRRAYIAATVAVAAAGVGLVWLWVIAANIFVDEWMPEPIPTPTVTVTAPPVTLPPRTVYVERATRSERRTAPATGAAQRYARSLVSAAQWTCLRELWTRESNWRTTADNPTSSAYGIPQALPGRKMASEGADWRTNPRTQIRWGLRYIEARYGSPCAALRFHTARGYY